MLRLIPRFLSALLLASGLTLSAFAQANSNTEVLYLDDVHTDFNLRFEAMGSAKTIDLVTFVHTFDEVGKRSAYAIRKALHKGAKVRIIYESVPSRLLDPNKDVMLKFLNAVTDKKLPRQAQVYANGAVAKFLAGLGYDDFFHEKLLIVDSGLPTEKIFIGGRGVSEFALNTADGAVLLKPANPNQPHKTGLALANAFENLWSTCGIYQSLEPARNFSAEDLAELKAVKTVRKGLVRNPLLYGQLRSYVIDGTAPDPKRSVLSEIQFFPDEVRVVQNNLILNVLAAGSGNSEEARRNLPDDIAESLGKLFSAAKHRIHVGTYLINFPEVIEQGLKTGMKNGAEVNLYTNSVSAHEALFYRGLPYFMNIDGMRALAGPSHHRQEVRLFLTAQPIGTWNKHPGGKANLVADTFSHFKIAVADDWVVMGSHNFTVSSSTRNSEMQVYFKDPRFAGFVETKLTSPKGLFREVPVEQVTAKAVPDLFPLVQAFINRSY